MASKQIQAMIDELRSWLPNYDHGPADYPTLVWRILASLPYGDEAEDMGYEPFNLGWHEADQLGRMLTAIEGKDDVEDLILGLLADESEDLEEAVEARRSRPTEWFQTPIKGAAHVSDGAMGYWAVFPRGTTARDVLNDFMKTADYSRATDWFTVTATTVEGAQASVRVGPEGEFELGEASELEEARRHRSTARRRR